jgi:hypothetical protein
MITIAMLIALNREAELKMHLRAAFNNGVTRDELKELIMHSALYCGLPAANATMHLAQQVFDDMDAACRFAGRSCRLSVLSLCYLHVRLRVPLRFATVTVPFDCPILRRHAALSRDLALTKCAIFLTLLTNICLVSSFNCNY